MPVVEPDDEQRCVVAAPDVDDFARPFGRADDATVDDDAISHAGSHTDHLLAHTIRPASLER